MSNVVRRIDNVLQPERQGNYNAGPASGAGTTVPRTAGAPAEAGNAALGDGMPYAGNNYTTTGARGQPTAPGTAAATAAGSHHSNLMNKLDPNFDSTGTTTSIPGAGTGASTTGRPQHHDHAGAAAVAGAAGGAVAAHHHNKQNAGATHPGPAPGTAGPHESNLLNKLDPRVDSSAVATGPAPSTAGPHRHDAMNQLDPRVDSTGGGNLRTGGTAGGRSGPAVAAPGTTATTGPAPTTAGPHRSDLANKLDPTVDSNAGATGPAAGAGYRRL